MIEFNPEAKADNPVAMALGAEGLQFFDQVQLSGVCLIDPTSKITEIIAKFNTEEGKAKKIHDFLTQAGYYEPPNDNDEPGLYSMVKSNTIIMYTSKPPVWWKLRNWRSLLLLTGAPKTLLPSVSNNLFKIAVLNYVVEKNAKGDLKMKSPYGDDPISMSSFGLPPPAADPSLSDWESNWTAQQAAQAAQTTAPLNFGDLDSAVNQLIAGQFNAPA